MCKPAFPNQFSLPVLSNITVECIPNQYYPFLASVINEPFPLGVKPTIDCALGTCAETHTSQQKVDIAWEVIQDKSLSSINWFVI